MALPAVSNGSKILIWKQITTKREKCFLQKCCFQWFKDTNLKANHNSTFSTFSDCLAVSNGSKILIWKQITTLATRLEIAARCFQWFKDTNLKANHNFALIQEMALPAVSNGSKILIWKQITTKREKCFLQKCCFQWFKDTNLKANHNSTFSTFSDCLAVSNGSKILIWKQITTLATRLEIAARCFQWFKDTNLKANHNTFSLAQPET